jgi:hypothetical protein
MQAVNSQEYSSLNSKIQKDRNSNNGTDFINIRQMIKDKNGNSSNQTAAAT